MSRQILATRTLDTSAIALSSVCLLHCLALPILASVLPLAGVLADVEWLHKAFVITAVPISVYAMLRNHSETGKAVFAGLATLGLGLLIAAAFVDSLQDQETALTVAGAACLAAAHIYRWVTHSAA